MCNVRPDDLIFELLDITSSIFFACCHRRFRGFDMFSVFVDFLRFLLRKFFRGFQRFSKLAAKLFGKTVLEGVWSVFLA